MPGLGRIPERKPQQENYLLSKVMTTVQTIPESEWPVKKNWKSLVNLNQGETGTCVGHGFAHRMEDAPVRRPKEEVDPFAIYRRACKLDAWPDNDSGDLQFGTSVDAGAQACQAMGLISNFYWAWDIHTAEEFVLNKGSLVIGVTWYEQMFEPVFVQVKPDVYRWIIRPDGRPAGGHCLIVNGRNRELGVWRLKNSWGKDWGQNGQVFMTDEDMNFLLADGGEFCWPQEIKR